MRRAWVIALVMLASACGGEAASDTTTSTTTATTTTRKPCGPDEIVSGLRCLPKRTTTTTSTTTTTMYQPGATLPNPVLDRAMQCVMAQVYAAQEMRDGRNPGRVVQFGRSQLCDEVFNAVNALPRTDTPAHVLRDTLMDNEGDLVMWGIPAAFGSELGEGMTTPSVDEAIATWGPEAQAQIDALRP